MLVEFTSNYHVLLFVLTVATAVADREADDITVDRAHDGELQGNAGEAIVLRHLPEARARRCPAIPLSPSIDLLSQGVYTHTDGCRRIRTGGSSANRSANLNTEKPTDARGNFESLPEITCLP